jgi:hypothetical protein
MGVGISPAQMWEMGAAANSEKPGHVIKSPCFLYLVTSWQGQPGPAFLVYLVLVSCHFFEMTICSWMHRNL